MDKTFVGLDIGGTKCAISVGMEEGGNIRILSREEFPTAGLSWRQVLDEFARRIDSLAHPSTPSNLSNPSNPSSLSSLSNPSSLSNLSSIGISCGGPLDSRRGVIMSPPNLPGWDDVPVVKFFEDRFHVPVAVQNDANACALAEYKYGSGRGVRNLVFMTFGTGLGAGIVIDGKLYAGANDNAGEIGHIRLAPTGPVGYNKEGSAEGFCSGAGIARLAKIRKGLDITAKELFSRVRAGDPDCTEVFRESAEKLATILAYTIDILNPEVIALGGVFMRNADLFMPIVDPILDVEALSLARKVCRIVPAELGESIGDYAALAVAAAQTNAVP
ncbi:MAG: ROK family protein [Kiritimatiellae bacterium]|nr:ROK family protein [Kiritimatiellia bacterium]